MLLKISELTAEQIQLRRQILEVSHLHHYSHLGSCLTMVDLIYAIHQVKKTQDIFVLSNGHAALAYYAVLEKLGILTRDEADGLMVHPDAWPEKQIMVSSGSLGQGLPIAAGWALADRHRNIYCSISDGECMEGSIWEALRITAEQQLTNLCVVINANGWGAYRTIDLSRLKKQFKALGFAILSAPGHDLVALKSAIKKHQKLASEGKLAVIFAKTQVHQFSFLTGQAAHYQVMSDAEYQLALKALTV